MILYNMGGDIVKEIMDANAMRRSMIRLAHEIIEKNKGTENLVLVGIKTRGEYLARRLCEMINSFEESNVPVVSLNISAWRDDVDGKDAVIEHLGIDVKDKIIVLVDDVLYKGRTVRAAMDGVMHYGRAKEIHLAVLIDRGHRELPIRADYVGKNVPTSEKEDIRVRVNEIDGSDGVILIEERERC